MNPATSQVTMDLSLPEDRRPIRITLSSAVHQGRKTASDWFFARGDDSPQENLPVKTIELTQETTPFGKRLRFRNAMNRIVVGVDPKYQFVIKSKHLR